MVANADDDRNAQPAPNEALPRREAQDRARGASGQASSPVDAMHVDAPEERDDAAGHREGTQRSE
jgi:hypothetical protein